MFVALDLLEAKKEKDDASSRRDGNDRRLVLL
jgi:hypothetical protein